jgi:hypothetical protein
MGATSILECWDWTYLVGTVKYGRDWNGKKVEKWDGGMLGARDEFISGFE